MSTGFIKSKSIKDNLTQKVMMNLWVAMAPNMVQTSELDSSRPTASPSKTAWKERASTVEMSLRFLDEAKEERICE